MQRFRDRIREIKTVKASELTDNEGNWRLHPDAQHEAVVGILGEIGKADVLKAYYSPRNGGKLTLLDGHLRKKVDPDEEWRVAILDLTDEEADKLILVFDPLAAMAEMDRDRVLALTDRVNTDDLALRELMRRMENDARRLGEDEEDEEGRENRRLGPPAMELMPFEHYDYVLLMFKNELDWLAAIDVLGLERRSDQRKTKKVGLCRVISGRQIVERIQVLEFELAQLRSRGSNATRDPQPQAG